MAAGRKLGEAYIAVTADARAVGDDLSKQAGEALDRAARKMGDTLDDALEDAVRDSTDGLGDTLGDELDRGTKRAGGRFQEQLRKSLSAAVTALPDITLGADSTEVDHVLAGVRSELSTLRDADIGVDLDANAALAQLDILDAQLAQLAAASVDVNVRADTAAARRELAGVQKAVRDVDGKGIDIPGTQAAAAGLNAVAAAGRVTASVGGVMGLSLGAVVPIIAGLVLVLGALVPVAVAAAGALLAVGTAAAAGLAVAVMGFSGVGDAMKLLTQREDALSSAVGGGGASAGAAASATRALANARQNAADSAEDAARRVMRAQEDLREAEVEAAASIARARRDAAEDIAAAVARYQQAEERLTYSLRAVERAQRDLTNARREATRDLEDLNEAVEDNARAQRGASDDLIAARALLDNVMGDTWASDAQREAAQLNYDEQFDRMDDLQRAARRLAEDQADAAKKGVDGSDRVTGAQERLTEATKDVADARREQADAAAGIDQARIDGAAAVAEAQDKAAKSTADAARSVEDALREQARSARQSAYSVESAMAAVSAASAGAGGAGASALAKINAELADIDPATLAFANFMRDRVQPAWDTLKSTAAAELLPGVQRGIEALEPLMPRFQTLVGNVAGSLGGMFERAGERLNSPFWVSFIDDLSVKAGPILEDLGSAAGNVVEGIAGIAQAFLGLADDEEGFDLAGMTEGFAEWGRTLKDNPEFQEFIDEVKETLPEIIEGAKNFGAALSDAFTWFNENGDTIMGVVDSVTAIFEWELPAFLDPEEWTAAGETLRENVLGIGTSVKDGFVEGFGSVKDFFSEKFNDAVTWVKDFFGIHSPSTMFAEFGGDIIDGLVGGFTGAVSGITTFFSGLPEKAGTALASLGSTIAGKFGDAFTSAKTAAGEKWESLRTWLTELPGKAVSAIGNLGTTLYNAGKDLIQGLVNGIAGAAGFVGDIAKNIVNGLIGFLNSKVIEPLNGMLEFTIGGKWGVPEITIDPPDIPGIPRLANGAIVRRATMAVVGEAGPEAVIPLSAGRAGRRAELMREAGLTGGGSVTIDARQYYEVRDTQTAEEVGAVIGRRVVRDVRNGVSDRFAGAAA